MSEQQYPSNLYNLQMIISYSFIRETPVFPLVLANLKRNPGENPGVGSIPLKSIVIFKQAQRAVELSIRTGSRSRSESAGINSTVRSYLHPVNRTPTDFPYTGRGWARWEINRRQLLVPAEFKGYHGVSLPSLQGNQTPYRNRY